MDTNRQLLALTGVVPKFQGRGGFNGPTPKNRPPLKTLKRRGIVGDDKALQRVDLDLGVVRLESAPVKLALSGNVLVCADVTVATDKIQVRFGDNGPFVPMGRNTRVKGLAFSYIYVVNAAQSGSTLVLLAATDNPDRGDVFDFRAV